MKVYQGQCILKRTQTLLNTSLSSAVAIAAIATPASAFRLTPVGTYSTGIFDDSAALISAYDPTSRNLFVTNQSSNQIDILNISDPTLPTPSGAIDISAFGEEFGSLNSVAFNNGLLAAAVSNKNEQDAGSVLFFNSDGTFLDSLMVGALPDMLTFTPDGQKLLIANEGEPRDDYAVDPLGSVSIIDLALGVNSATIKTADFTAFNSQKLDSSVRIFGPDASVAQDLEPEYIAISEDSKTAWVTLQENNAIGILDIETGWFKDIVGLGFKDLSLPENALDASNADDGIFLKTYPNLFGMYQPDEIGSYTVGGKTYLVTANEGDSRQYEFEDENGVEQVALDEEADVADLPLDPTAFPNAETLQKEENLGNLEVTNTLGDTDGDGDFDRLFAFGGRSFSIWDETVNLVFDSGNDLESITARFFPENFNSTNDENQSFDDRSDNKGPEPEGVAIASLFDRTFAFIGLERIGGIMTYDITNPYKPFFVDYVNNRDFSIAFDVDEEGDPNPTAAQLAAVGDLGPEGLLFISAKDSPNGIPLLVSTNEVSGTTTIYTARVPEPSAAIGLLGVGALGWLAKKRQRHAD
ncbi:choice-of-anchor I family protein [Phormidium sp. CCY1219]|uniref:choice-of-anchor I family protein n=1 Tax=Phormidium sp. CCY1219 TaxID=2886104 RepID=UPI002D1F4471|nr:choice-of-anchor I family protein [Phormidium sp. CCY1219]MEB3828212.1 choice-of-anchor I family protein [Phormidium sp. CCY1219]